MCIKVILDKHVIDTSSSSSYNHLAIFKTTISHSDMKSMNKCLPIKPEEVLVFTNNHNHIIIHIHIS